MYFVHRDWEAGPLGKRVRHVPGRTVLAWFQGLWEPDGLERAHADLMAAPYELELLRECGDEPPEDMVELRRRIRVRLYADNELHIDDHSVRIRSMGVHLEEAFLFVDDERVAEQPERWAYPLHPSWPLPDAAAPGPAPFVPPSPCVEVAPAGDTGATYLLFTSLNARHDTLGWDETYVFPGVRLPRSGAALRRPPQDPDAWPRQLHELRALVGPGEDGIAPALGRLGRAEGEPLVHAGEHLVQMVVRKGTVYEHAYAFDDVWASAHPDLAASLIHYAYHWDPGCTRRHGFMMPCTHDAYLDLRLGEADRVRDYEPYDEPLVTALTGARSVDELRREIFQDAGAGERRLLVVLGLDHHSELIGVVGAVLGHPAPDACELRYLRMARPRRPRQLARLGEALCYELRREGYSTLVLARPPSSQCRRWLGTPDRVVPLSGVRLPRHYAWQADPFRL